MHTASLLSVGTFPFLKQILGHCLLASDACLEFLAIPFIWATQWTSRHCVCLLGSGAAVPSHSPRLLPAPLLWAHGRVSTRPCQEVHQASHGGSLWTTPPQTCRVHSLFRGTHNISPRQTICRARNQVPSHVKGLGYTEHLLRAQWKGIRSRRRQMQRKSLNI